MDSSRGTASKHGAAIERKDTYAFERSKGGTEKQVDREDIGAARLRIIPQRELRVIAEPLGIRGIMLHRVEEPAAGDGAAGLRHGNALIERPIKRGKSEVADHPAVSKVIVEHIRVSVVEATARRPSQRGKERVVCGRARQGVAVFVKNLERDVDRFDVLIRTDISIAVRRRTPAEAL